VRSIPAPVSHASTFLFVPGDRPDRFDKAARAGADVVILDLEDAVPDESKASARAHVAAWLAHGGVGCVRVNSSASQHHWDDIEALSEVSGLCGVIVPKADLGVDWAGIAGTVDRPVVALVETAAGIHVSNSLARDPDVARLAFGHLDYAVDIGAEPTRTAMLHARSQLVLASRLGEKPPPIDGVTTAVDDVEALTADISHSRDLGMGGKLLIHPSQVVPARVAFTPSDEEVRTASRIMAAALTGAATKVDGFMVDAPVISRARRILRAAGVPEQPTPV
jgi:citrate lyase subunit beta/citryl-CoA lyase